jgi:hypothetical protein
MSLFMCQACGCVENTACCNYWSSQMDGKPKLCSECDPTIGKWHERFTRRSAVGMLIDQSGHLWGKDASLPSHYTIMGEVMPPAIKEPK